MEKKNIYFLIFILVALLITGFVIYYSKKMEISEILEIPVPGKEYSYENIIYNFWGFVVEKEGNTISVEGVIPEPEKTQTEEESLITIKFKITANTKIVKLETVKLKEPEEETKQISVGPEAIQINDHLALKTDKIDIEKKEAIATDILILESLPALPLPEEKTTPTPNQ